MRILLLIHFVGVIAVIFLQLTPNEDTTAAVTPCSETMHAAIVEPLNDQIMHLGIEILDIELAAGTSRKLFRSGDSGTLTRGARSTKRTLENFEVLRIDLDLLALIIEVELGQIPCDTARMDKDIAINNLLIGLDSGAVLGTTTNQQTAAVLEEATHLIVIDERLLNKFFIGELVFTMNAFASIHDVDELIVGRGLEEATRIDRDLLRHDLCLANGIDLILDGIGIRALRGNVLSHELFTIRKSAKSILENHDLDVHTMNADIIHLIILGLITRSRVIPILVNRILLDLLFGGLSGLNGLGSLGGSNFLSSRHSSVISFSIILVRMTAFILPSIIIIYPSIESL
nr:MAG TPA: hypothetical protein [Caudoviricetes sp.]